MAMRTKSKSVAQKLTDLVNDAGSTDFDPEDSFMRDAEESDDDSGSSVDGDTGREHYEEVGKSKLRKSAFGQLGPDYRGSKVSRDALDESGDEHDPFAGDEDESEDVSEVNETQSEDLDSDEEELDDEENDSEEYDDDPRHKTSLPTSNDDDTNEIKRILAQSQKAVTSTLSQGIKEEVEKGTAIKEQRALFDKLLGVRIKLQKALISANTLSTVEYDQEGNDAVKSAESAAFRLLQSLDSLRKSFSQARTGEKRKYDAITSTDGLEVISTKLQAYATATRKQRNATLDLWATKTRQQSNIIQQRRLGAQANIETSLSQVLAEQLGDMSRLVSKTQVPRSCAPVQARKVQDSSNSTSVDESNLAIYDDADFYGTLLQTLISQRSTDESALAGINVSFPLQPWQAVREAKTKKNVDTKASKGRRLRYTVHEKLQDSMARDDRTTWTTRQCDELFASILGRKIELVNRVDEDDDGHVGEGMESLRLFASA